MSSASRYVCCASRYVRRHEFARRATDETGHSARQRCRLAPADVATRGEVGHRGARAPSRAARAAATSPSGRATSPPSRTTTRPATTTCRGRRPGAAHSSPARGSATPASATPRHVPARQVGRRPGRQPAQLGAPEPGRAPGRRPAQHLGRADRPPDQRGDLQREPGVGEQVPGVVAAPAARPQPDRHPGVRQRRHRRHAPPHGQVAARRVRRGGACGRHPRHLGVGHPAQVRQGDVGGQPAPLVEQLQGPPAVPLRRDLDVDLLVALRPPPQPVARGDLPQQRERLRPVAVHTRRPDGDLHRDPTVLADTVQRRRDRRRPTPPRPAGRRGRSPARTPGARPAPPPRRPRPARCPRRPPAARSGGGRRRSSPRTAAPRPALRPPRRGRAPRRRRRRSRPRPSAAASRASARRACRAACGTRFAAGGGGH